MILYQTSQLWIVLGNTFCKDVFVERFYIIIFVNECLICLFYLLLLTEIQNNFYNSPKTMVINIVFIFILIKINFYNSHDFV